MDHADHSQRRTEVDPRQRVIRRNRLFVLMPIIAISIAVLLIAWEIVRLNLPSATRSNWPWRLNLLDLQSAATIFTVLLAILLTRAQYAQVTRPMIGWGLYPADESFRLANLVHNSRGPLWRIDIFNGGGGPAVVESLQYRISSATDTTAHWLDYHEAIQVLEAGGLVFSKDFVIIEYGAGAPLVPTTSPRRGILVAVFTANALRELYIFDVRILVKDGVGDLHERMLNCAPRASGYLRTRTSDLQGQSPGEACTNHPSADADPAG